jgi:Nitrite and sulphite reductase 4Fe-4S domain
VARLHSVPALQHGQLATQSAQPKPCTAALQIGFNVELGGYFSIVLEISSTLNPDPESCTAALQVGFNVELGGYFSIKRNAVSMDGDTFLMQAQVVPYCQALLEVYRWATA